MLDIGAGTGRHAVLLAQMSFYVDAIDISNSAISMLEDNSRKSVFPFGVLRWDMHFLDELNRKYDAIIAVNSVYHTDEVGLQKIIYGINQSLNSYGIGYVSFLSIEDKAYCGQKVQKKAEEDGSVLEHIYLSMDDVGKYLGEFDILSLKTIRYGDKAQPSVHYSVVFQKKD